MKNLKTHFGPIHFKTSKRELKVNRGHYFSFSKYLLYFIDDSLVQGYTVHSPKNFEMTDI